MDPGEIQSLFGLEEPGTRGSRTRGPQRTRSTACFLAFGLFFVGGLVCGPGYLTTTPSSGAELVGLSEEALEWWKEHGATFAFAGPGFVEGAEAATKTLAALKNASYYWVVGERHHSCDWSCRQRGGCSKEATWPQDRDSILKIAQSFLLPCGVAANLSFDASLPGVKAGVCGPAVELSGSPCEAVPTTDFNLFCPCKLTKLRHAPTLNLSATFVFYDLDESGDLALWEIAQHVGNTQAAELMKDMDENGDASVSEEEFISTVFKNIDAETQATDSRALHDLNASRMQVSDGAYPASRNLFSPMLESLMMHVAYNLILGAFPPLAEFIDDVYEYLANATEYVKHQILFHSATGYLTGWNWEETKTADADLEKHLPLDGASVPIRGIFTIGAPGVLLRLKSECSWPGSVRVIARGSPTRFSLLPGIFDLVPAIAGAVGYAHIPMDVLVVATDPGYEGDSYVMDCDADDTLFPAISGTMVIGAVNHPGGNYNQGALRLFPTKSNITVGRCQTSDGVWALPECSTPCEYSWTSLLWWCYIGQDQQEWKECPASCPTACQDDPVTHWAPNQNCVNRFEYKGTWHDGTCALSERSLHGEPYGWCSGSERFNGTWYFCDRACKVEEEIGHGTLEQSWRGTNMASNVAYVTNVSAAIDAVALINERFPNKSKLRLVGMAVAVAHDLQIDTLMPPLLTLHQDEQRSFLLQDEGDNSCAITFKGTETFYEWVTDFQAKPSAFCGFLDEHDTSSLAEGHAFAHQGFVERLRHMVRSPEFQLNIRAKMPKCSSVTAIGHSLGGAMATLFATCVHRAPKKGEAGYSDFALMGWARSEHALLPPLTA